MTNPNPPKINETTFDFNNQMLNGVILRPDPEFCLGKLLFNPGISSKWQDYMPMLEQLGHLFEVHAYSLRGHGKSTGVFSVQAAARDSTAVAKFFRPDAQIGHSLGAHIAAVSAYNADTKAVYMINPVISTDCLPEMAKKGLNVVNRVKAPLRFLDILIGVYKVGPMLGFNNRTPLEDMAKLKDIHPHPTNADVAFALSDSDEVLGTLNNPDHYHSITDLLNSTYPNAINQSEYVRGWNHCLNMKKGDLQPFFKDEDKARKPFLEAMICFLSKYSDRKNERT